MKFHRIEPAVREYFLELGGIYSIIMGNPG